MEEVRGEERSVVRGREPSLRGPAGNSRPSPSLTGEGLTLTAPQEASCDDKSGGPNPIQLTSSLSFSASFFKKLNLYTRYNLT